MTHPVPQDVVPRAGITAAAIRLLNTAQHKPIHISIPGDIITDTDGVPVGVGEPVAVIGTATVRISRAELTRNGLTEQEVPNVRIGD